MKVCKNTRLCLNIFAIVLRPSGRWNGTPSKTGRKLMMLREMGDEEGEVRRKKERNDKGNGEDANEEGKCVK